MTGKRSPTNVIGEHNAHFAYQSIWWHIFIQHNQYHMNSFYTIQSNHAGFIASDYESFYSKPWCTSHLIFACRNPVNAKLSLNLPSMLQPELPQLSCFTIWTLHNATATDSVVSWPFGSESLITLHPIVSILDYTNCIISHHTDIELSW